MTEGAPRYRLKKLEAGPARDGRADQATALDGYGGAVEAIQVALEDGRLTGEGRRAQVRQTYEILVRDHGHEGSYQAVVRHLRRRHGPSGNPNRRPRSSARTFTTALNVKPTGRWGSAPWLAATPKRRDQGLRLVRISNGIRVVIVWYT